MRNRPHRWALPPLTEFASRAERRDQMAAETEARAEIRWIWNEVCSGLHLTRRIVPTGTASFEPPRLGRIRLGPPTTFTVELRPGQLIDDLLAIDDRLAAAYGVDDIEVHRLVENWVRIVLVEHRAVGPGWTREIPERPDPDTGPVAVGTDEPVRDEAGRRGWRGSSGGPRSRRWWRSPHRAR
jgi:hypothetical protein